MDINYDGDLSKTRTCFRKNTTVFLENYVRVFGKLRRYHTMLERRRDWPI